jgi:hypothetical protein
LLFGIFVMAAAAAAPREQAATGRIAMELPSPPKPTGPIAVDYRFAGSPVVGQAFDVSITARGPEAVVLVLEASAADPASLFVVAQTSGFDRDGERTWVVTIVPLLPRQSYLDVLVTGDIDGVTQARNVVIPIRTERAGGAAAPAGEVAVCSGGEKLILLPVDERP